MIRDSGGNKMSPRQKAAEILLVRLGNFAGIDVSQVGEMTDRETSLVNKQIEKIHNKINNSLLKIRKEEQNNE